MIIKSTSLKETHNIAALIVQKINKTGGIIALDGNLGAGKTTLIQSIAKKMGINEKVTSPTFVLIHQHQIPKSDRYLYHLDLYRLENTHSLKEIGLVDLLNNPNQNIIVIEWAQKAKDLLPKQTIKIKIQTTSPSSREFIIDNI